jgi:hypothetical protein
VIDRFLVLGLRLGKHIDGFVDSYYGPEEVRAQVEAEQPTAPRKLADEAAELLALAVDMDGQRGVWLRAQLVGLETVSRRLAGDEITWVEEVQRCHGVTPRLTPEVEFEQAHAQLDAAFGDADGYGRWRESQAVPADKLLAAAQVLNADARERTRELFGLPDGEQTSIEIVSDEPWAAFNYYQGGLRSRVVINADLPTYSYFLAGMAPHELYAGHHTEHAWKEQLLVHGQGVLEESIILTGTPQSTISEGIAMVAAGMLYDDVHEWAAELLRPLGVPYDVDGAHTMEAVDPSLRKVSDNIAWFLNEEQRPLDEVVEYGMRWRRLPRDHIEKTIEFATDPTWRAYTACYTNGHELVQRWVDGDRGRFRRLLTEQLTPADLVPGPPPA